MRMRPPQAPFEDQAPSPIQDWVDMPAEMALDRNPSGTQGRVRVELSTVAGRPLDALDLAVAVTQGEPRLARACAEMAVTGSGAWREFQKLDPVANQDALPALVAARAVGANPALTPVVARQRADEFVAWARNTSKWVRAPNPAAKLAAYNVLHPSEYRFPPWVAVCGEKDPPDRPVNVKPTHFNQKDVQVTVGGKSIRVRVGYSDNVKTAGSNTPTLLFLHGLGSRLEEADGIGGELVKQKGYGVVAVDLPNQGYSERFSFDAVGLKDIANTGTRDANDNYVVYAMEFYLKFLQAFIATFPTEFPGAAVPLRAIGGGSQGGCLTLRLAMDAPQLAQCFLPWSPGSAWKSFLDGGDDFRAVLNHGPIHDVVASENPASRFDYISGMFDRPVVFGVLGPREVDLWWSRSWNGRFVEGDGARAVRWEVYDEWHRRWCSAMAQEQLAYSFAGRDLQQPQGRWPLDSVLGPMLLMTGADDGGFANIHGATEDIARRASDPNWGTLVRPKGYQVTFPSTGHSIHDERPTQLVKEIRAFIEDKGPFP